VRHTVLTFAAVPATPNAESSEPRASARTPETTEARLTELVTQHFEFIWRLLRRSGLDRSDADDATQQVFMILTQKLDRIRPGSERSFLYGAALRVAANVRRGNRRRASEPAPMDVQAPGGGPERRAELGRAWALLDELFARLAPELGRVLALAEIEQLEMKEIAELEQIPMGTAASRLRRARERFQSLLEELGARRPFGGSDAG
jgi:RNA polymerase sigma-70 factor (ECF subfamily)